MKTPVLVAFTGSEGAADSRGAWIYRVNDMVYEYSEDSYFFVRMVADRVVVMKFSTGSTQIERLGCAIDMAHAFVRDGVWTPGGEQR